jgi:hypothetical protein
MRKFWRIFNIVLTSLIAAWAVFTFVLRSISIGAGDPLSLVLTFSLCFSALVASAVALAVNIFLRSIYGKNPMIAVAAVSLVLSGGIYLLTMFL